jgi:hypothetical protein
MTKNVFLSWSKDRSRVIAEVFFRRLPHILPSVNAFMSPHIAGGELGIQAIHKALDGAAFGLAFLTPENVTETWLNYECGALSAQLASGKGKVATVVLDIEGLQHLQFTKLTAAGIKKLMTELNELLGEEDKRSTDVLNDAIDQWWPVMELEITTALKGLGEVQSTPRSIDGKVTDTLNLLINLSRNVVNGTTDHFHHDEDDVEWELYKETARTAIFEQMGEERASKLAFEEGTTYVNIRVGGGQPMRIEDWRYLEANISTATGVHTNIMIGGHRPTFM